MRGVLLAIATGCGVGYVPFAPGTFGSLLGLLVWSAIGPSLLPQLMAIGLLLIVGAWSGSVAERHFKATDPGPVVVDEVLGMLVTLLAVPVGWGAVLIGFFVFRLFDVIKPYPANRLERLPGGLGMMADDLMAAVYANLVLRAVLSAGDLLA
jgi:phosphatidylglycerophosphatase A